MTACTPASARCSPSSERTVGTPPPPASTTTKPASSRAAAAGASSTSSGSGLATDAPPSARPVVHPGLPVPEQRLRLREREVAPDRLCAGFPRWFIVIPDMFGNGLSSSPSNTGPPVAVDVP